MKRIVVVGAGIGGLTAGALLAKEGHEVTVLEAMTELAGCAGKYKRHPYLFAAGATLGMALEPGGIHERVFRTLDIDPPAEELEKVMTLHHPQFSISYYKDRATFLEEITSHFPSYKLQLIAFYEDVFHYAQLIRELMKPLPAMPPSSARDMTGVLQVLKVQHSKLFPLLFQPLEFLLKKHHLQNLSEFRHVLDGILIDSMQTTSREASALFSCIALDIYHQGAYYMPGGLYRFGEELATYIRSNGGQIKKPRRVVKMTREEMVWKVEDHRGNVYEADEVVFNGDPRQLEKLLPPNDSKRLPKRVKEIKDKPTWGTYSLYIAIDSTHLPQPLEPFQQISQGLKAEMDEGWHFFVSASKPEDRLRAPEGFQTITISTHTNLDYWETKEQYDRYREILKERILGALEVQHPGFQDAIVLLEEGAPRAWENYTLRSKGYVGGFAQKPFHALFGAISHRTGLPGLYLCGDHIFPGGGTIGVTTSGIHVARSITQKKLID